MPDLSVITDVALPSGDEVRIVRRRFGDPSRGKRVAIVAGIRGDAPQGIEVAHQVGRFLAEVEDSIAGAVDIVPCANPLAAERGTRNWPYFDLDLNRRFPGRAHGHPPDRVAAALVEHITGADQVIELRGARPAFNEATQAHVRFRNDAAAELAQHANVAVVWRRRPGPAAPATFAHQFPGCIVLEGGTGNRLQHHIGEELRDGVLNILAVLGVLAEEQLPFPWAALVRPQVVTDEGVLRVRAGKGGLFLPTVQVWQEVAQGEVLGRVVDPIEGEVHEEICSPAAGRVMALREQPVVYAGSTVARVVCA